MSIPPISVTPPKDAQAATLTVFGRSDWFRDLANSSIWLRIHVLVGVPRDQMRKQFESISKGLELDGPVAASIGYIGDLKFVHFDHDLHASDAGELVWSLDGRERQLPNAIYTTLATPYQVDGAEESKPIAHARLARASALLVLHFGYNFLRDVVFDGEVNMATAQLSIRGRVLRTPQPADGPFMHTQMPGGLGEIRTALALSPIEIRRRIELALEFFDRGVRQEEQFFNYWTALEILCNGKAQRIRSRLQSCYHLRRVREVDEGLGFGCIARWRHDYFHKGIRPWLQPDAERYLQLIFLDLLRFELDLGLLGYAVGMQNSEGFDLSSLGLRDRRTPEQLEAVRRSKEMSVTPTRTAEALSRATT